MLFSLSQCENAYSLVYRNCVLWDMAPSFQHRDKASLKQTMLGPSPWPVYIHFLLPPQFCHLCFWDVWLDNSKPQAECRQRHQELLDLYWCWILGPSQSVPWGLVVFLWLLELWGSVCLWSIFLSLAVVPRSCGIGLGPEDGIITKCRVELGRTKRSPE